MKKQLLSVLALALSLSACQTGQTLVQAPAPAQLQSYSQSSPAAQAVPRQTTRARTQTSKPTPQIPAGLKASPAASRPAAMAAPVSSAKGAPAVQLSSNYNTQTLIAGLRSGADLDDAKAIAARHGLSVDRYIASIRTVVFNTQGQPVPALLEALKAESGLEFIEADQVASQKPENETEVSESFRLFALNEVNDKYFADQYGLQSLHVPEAWSLNQGADTIVAVIDTGVDLGHADLKGRLVPGYDAFSLKEGGDAGDVSSLNYIMSSYKHGSHEAGVIAAATNNGKGIAGVAPEAKVMPIKIFPDLSDIITSIVAPGGDENQTIVSILADSIVWAADHGADVINMSLAVNEPSATIERAVKYALSKNVSVIVAAGNDRHLNNARNYLAAIDGVVGVGATGATDEITMFSNSGDYVSVAAPGEDIISTVPSLFNLKSYVKMSGTSMAAPHVAGVAALLKSKFGAKATPAWIKQRLEATATDRGAAGRDDLYGHGLVNAAKALED